jgi:hypothetical protein
MAQQSRNTIEFIHGPLDGHIEILSIAAEQLPESIICYISENIFRLLDGRTEQHAYRITSAAIYKRQRRIKSWNYTFAAAIAPDQVAIEPMVKPSASDEETPI